MNNSERSQKTTQTMTAPLNHEISAAGSMLNEFTLVAPNRTTTTLLPSVAASSFEADEAQSGVESTDVKLDVNRSCALLAPSSPASTDTVIASPGATKVECCSSNNNNNANCRRYYHHELDDLIEALRNYIPSTTSNSSKWNMLTRPAVRRLMSLIAGINKCPATADNNNSDSNISDNNDPSSTSLLLYFDTSLRNCRSLVERMTMDFLMLHQSQTQITKTLWLAVRNRGCQFLGPAMQEETLKLVLVALGDGSALSRKMLVLFVVQKLQPQFPRASKTSIGHVVQLLYRASCFKLQKRQEESSLMQLKEEFRTYETLRREHDAQVVQIAIDAGLKISAETWSVLLHGDSNHKYHMNAVIDRIQRQPIVLEENSSSSSSSSSLSPPNSSAMCSSVQSFTQILAELKHVLHCISDPFKLIPTIVADLNCIYHAQMPHHSNASLSEFECVLTQILRRLSNCLFIYSTKSNVIQSSFRRHYRPGPLVCARKKSLSNSVEFLNLNGTVAGTCAAVASTLSSTLAASTTADPLNSSNSSRKLHRRTWSNSMSSLAHHSTSVQQHRHHQQQQQSSNSMIKYANKSPTTTTNVYAGVTSIVGGPADHKIIAATRLPPPTILIDGGSHQAKTLSKYGLQSPSLAATHVNPPPGLVQPLFPQRTENNNPRKSVAGPTAQLPNILPYHHHQQQQQQTPTVTRTASSNFKTSNAEFADPSSASSASSASSSSDCRSCSEPDQEDSVNDSTDLTSAIICLDRQIENLQIKKQKLLNQILPPIPNLHQQHRISNFDDPYDAIRRVESVPNLYGSSIQQQQQHRHQIHHEPHQNQPAAFNVQHSSPSCNYLTNCRKGISSVRNIRSFERRDIVVPFSETLARNKFGPISRDRPTQFSCATNNFSSSLSVLDQSADSFIQSDFEFELFSRLDSKNQWSRHMMDHHDPSTLRHAQSLPVIQDEEDVNECNDDDDDPLLNGGGGASGCAIEGDNNNNNKDDHNHDASWIRRSSQPNDVSWIGSIDPKLRSPVYFY